MNPPPLLHPPHPLRASLLLATHLTQPPPPLAHPHQPPLPPPPAHHKTTSSAPGIWDGARISKQNYDKYEEIICGGA